MPAVHLTLMAPPLEHLARRTRLSLLCSITKAGPDELWAILQQEQTWFEAMKEDLHWLVDGQRRQVAGTTSCTLARVVCAVQAVRSMVEAPSPPTTPGLLQGISRQAYRSAHPLGAVPQGPGISPHTEPDRSRMVLPFLRRYFKSRLVLEHTSSRHTKGRLPIATLS